MCRTFFIVLLILGAKPGHTVDWNQQVLSLALVSGYEQQNNDQERQVTDVQLQAHATKLFQGVGLNMVANLGQSQPNASSYASHTNYELQTSSRIFISPNINFDIALSRNDQMTVSDPLIEVFRDDASLYQQTQGSTVNAQLNLGSDQSKRSLTLSLDQATTKTFVTEQFSLYSDERQLLANVHYQNKISEDSFIVAKYAQSEQDKTIDAVAPQKLSLKKVYLGFKTAYFSNSNVEFLIGNSNSDKEGSESSENVFSWKINNTIRISDYLVWQLSTGEDIQDSNDPKFVSSETYEIATNLQYLFSDNIGLNVEINSKTRQYGELTESTQNTANVAFAYNVLEQLTLNTSIKYYENNDSRELYSIDGYQWSFGIKWRLI